MVGLEREETRVASATTRAQPRDSEEERRQPHMSVRSFQVTSEVEHITDPSPPLDGVTNPPPDYVIDVSPPHHAPPHGKKPFLQELSTDIKKYLKT